MAGEIYLSSAAFSTAWEDIGKNVCTDSVNESGYVISLSSIGVENYYDDKKKDDPSTPSLWYSVAEKVFQLPAYKAEYSKLSGPQKAAAIKILEGKLAEKFGSATLYDVIMENGSKDYWFFTPWDDFKSACATHNRPNTRPKGQLLPANINLKIQAKDINTAMTDAKKKYPVTTPAGCPEPEAPEPYLQYLPLIPGQVQTVMPSLESTEFLLTIYSDSYPIRTGALAFLQVTGGKLFNPENSAVRIYKEDGSEVTATILEDTPDIEDGLIKITLKADAKPGTYRVSVISSKIIDPVAISTSVSKDNAHTEVTLHPFTIIIEDGTGEFKVEAQRAAVTPPLPQPAKPPAEDEGKEAKAIAAWKKKCGRISNKERRGACTQAAESKDFASAQRIYDEEMAKQDQACALKHCGKLDEPTRGTCETDVEDNDLNCADTKRKYPIPVKPTVPTLSTCPPGPAAEALERAGKCTIQK